jgi:hypothetical protein
VALRLAPLVVALAPLAACETEERIVSARGAFRTLPGATADIPASSALPPSGRAPALDQALPAAGDEPVDPEEASRDPLRVEQEDGSVRLICTSPRHLVWHLQQTLINEEYDLIYEQLLSDRTIDEYRRRGLDPRSALEFFRSRREEVLALLARMPRGELTPGVFIRRVGGGVHRLQPVGRVSGSTLEALDFAWESGACRLVVIR